MAKLKRSSVKKHASIPAPSKGRSIPGPDEVGPNVVAAPRIDGRSLRRTGRTLQFGSRVSPAFDTLLRELAQRDGISLAEVLERALALYDKASS